MHSVFLVIFSLATIAANATAYTYGGAWGNHFYRNGFSYDNFARSASPGNIIGVTGPVTTIRILPRIAPDVSSTTSAPEVAPPPFPFASSAPILPPAPINPFMGPFPPAGFGSNNHFGRYGLPY